MRHRPPRCPIVVAFLGVPMIVFAAVSENLTFRSGEPVPRYAFVIVSYNTLALTRAAMTSITRYCRDFPHEIIVVDNHSSDDTVPTLQSEFLAAKFISFDGNRGYAVAANAGAGIAAAEWLVLMNSDAE